MTPPILLSQPMRANRAYAKLEAPDPNRSNWIATITKLGSVEVWESGRWEWSDTSGNRVATGNRCGAQEAATECEQALLALCKGIISLETVTKKESKNANSRSNR
jgi:hypothetical protein